MIGRLKAIFFLVLVFCALGGRAQKHDYVWLSGYASGAHVDSITTGYKFGTTRLDFRKTPVSIEFDSLKMNFYKTVTMYCDSDATLLFYTNGIYVANSLEETIENGDSLNAGWLQYTWDPTIKRDGYRNFQGILALQQNANHYVLIHSYIDSIPGTFGGYYNTQKILATWIDMSANGGHGRVISKNETLIKDSLAIELTAVRHGNGKDWWIVAKKTASNCYYLMLLTSNGLQVMPSLICGGAVYDFDDVGAVTFSPDGSKLIHFMLMGGINIYDFDRCAGGISNPIHIPLNVWASGLAAYGVAVSPSNRFLYVSAERYIFQYDLWSSDFGQSVDTVGMYDGYKSPFGSIFSEAQSAPNGKIYISCGNTEMVYHVINEPDKKGDSCNFAQHSVRLQTLSSTVPNFPNYRLGRLPGSACDTLWTNIDEATIQQREKNLKLFPNPATDYLTIDYGFTDWSKAGEIRLEIVNELGQLVYSQALPRYSGFQKLDVSRYAAGMYTAYIKRGNAVVATGKFAKE